MKSNPFKDFFTKNRESHFNLEKYTHIYTRLIKTATFQDPLFGATLLYYFLSQANFSLENCLRGLMIYPIESLFIYVGFKLNSQYDQFNKTFNNNNNSENTIEVVNNNKKMSLIYLLTILWSNLILKADLLFIKRNALALTQTPNDHKQLIDLLNVSKLLLKLLAQKFSTQWRSICEFIELIVILYERLSFFNAATKDENQARIDEELASATQTLTSIVEEWLTKEFVESLLVNNGMTRRRQEDISKRKDWIDKYNNWKPQSPSRVLNLLFGILLRLNW